MYEGPPEIFQSTPSKSKTSEGARVTIAQASRSKVLTLHLSYNNASRLILQCEPSHTQL